MEISRNNYEIFFLDYHEGRLSIKETEELMSFLELHQDLKEEFRLFENITLIESDDKVVFPGKNMLKKPEVMHEVSGIHKANYQEVFIAFHEGDLNEQEKKDLFEFLNENPFLKEEFDLFAQLKIQPEEDIHFSRKEQLKRKVTLFKEKVYLRYAASIVSAVLLAFAGYVGLNHYFSSDIATLAEYSVRQNLPGTERKRDIEKKDYSSEYIPEFNYNNVTAQLRKPEMIAIEKIPFQKAGYISPKKTLSEFYTDQVFREEYAEIYTLNNERLRQIRQNEELAITANEPRLFDRVVDIVRENTQSAGQQISGISPWQLAEYGVKGFNLLTDNNIDFSVKSNDAGEVTKVAFNDFAIPLRSNR